MSSPDRRSFLSASALGLGGLAFLDKLPAVSAAEAQVDPKLVKLDPQIEPLVRLLEETPRDKVLEEVGSRVKSGTPYRDVLAALLLAGVRNVQPRPVGFKFHAVLVVNSAHLASLASPDRERWLPIFWAIDNFKVSQARNQAEGGWRMPRVDESKVPAAHQVEDEFLTAMNTWDETRADTAAAGLARFSSTDRAFNLFARIGCRDFRDIGHKAIFVANAFRTLQIIGPQHAEPVYRSLAYALLEHEGDNPAKRDADQDRPGRKNLEIVSTIRADWLDGKPNPAIVESVLERVRSDGATEVSQFAANLVNKGARAGDVWDGLFLAAGELLMRQPGIVGLHTLTTLNALHYTFQTAADETTRKLVMLQGASFLPMFLQAMKSRGKVGDVKIEELGPAAQDEKPTLENVFDTLSTDRMQAARLAMSVQKQPDGARRIADAGRMLVFLKGTDSHDYKFSSAVLEDYSHITPAWRDRFLAASLFWLKGSKGKNSPLLDRTRAALT